MQRAAWPRQHLLLLLLARRLRGQGARLLRLRHQAWARRLGSDVGGVVGYCHCLPHCCSAVLLTIADLYLAAKGGAALAVCQL